jgi:hypothetical protein
MPIKFNQVILDKLKKGRQETLSKKVDLALVNDFESIFNNIDLQTDSLIDDLGNLARQIDAKTLLVNDILREIEAANNLANQLRDAYTDLGINMPTDIGVNISQLEANRNLLSEAQSRIETAAEGFYELEY